MEPYIKRLQNNIGGYGYKEIHKYRRAGGIDGLPG